MEKSEGTGERIGGYRVVRRLATGGTSDVLLAKAEGPHGFERTVVLKLLLSQFKHDEEVQRMFAREAAAYARLSHPSIVRLFDFFALDGQLVMVLEHVDGPPLSRLRGMLKAVGQPLDDKAAIYVAQRLFDALAAAHAATDDAGAAAPVIHRDVNPANVLIPWDAHVKLADFGVAKVTGSTHHSSTGLIKGTFGYMAPEQITGETVTPRADVYAGAIVLWEMLTKRRAFQRGALPEIEVLRVMAEPKVVSLDVLRPDVDREVREAVRRALEPQAERRRITAEEMVSILREVVPSEAGREHLAKALATVRHEPKPQYTIPPPTSLDPPPGVGARGEGHAATPASRPREGPSVVPRPVAKTIAHGRTDGSGSAGASARPLPRPTPPPMPGVALPPSVRADAAPQTLAGPAVASRPTTPPEAATKTVAAPPPFPADDERPTQIPLTAAPSTQLSSSSREVRAFDSHVEPPELVATTGTPSERLRLGTPLQAHGVLLKDAINEILKSVPSSLPPRLLSEIPTGKRHETVPEASSLSVETRDLGKIPGAPGSMNAAAPTERDVAAGLPGGGGETGEHTLMMASRPVPPNPDLVATVIPKPMTPSHPVAAPEVAAPPRLPAAARGAGGMHGITAPMPTREAKMAATLPTPAGVSPTLPQRAAIASSPAAAPLMFPSDAPPARAPSAASYSGAIASVPPEAAGVPRKRGALPTVAVLVVLVGAAAGGAVGYVRWERSHASAASAAAWASSSSAAASAASAAAASVASSSASSAAASSASPSARAPAASGVAPAASASGSAPAIPASAAPAASALAPGMGLVKTSSAAPGHRIFLDDRVIGQTPDAIAVKCGGHFLKIGSNGFRRPVEVPCGGELVIDK